MRDFLTFRLNGKTRILRDVSPTMTLLNYLRDLEALTGLKEGCAEGDCGACTLVIGERIEGKARYRAINACIQFIAMLEGKSVFTIEYLKCPTGELHPVQQALVDEHGSQCGFCTPGMVMSAVDLLQKNKNPNEKEIRDWLEGNICRCTGYQGIVAAVKDAASKM